MAQSERRDSLLRGSPAVGRGDAPDGQWELRARHDRPDSDFESGWFSMYIELFGVDGSSVGGRGCGGVGFANDQRPVVLSVSGYGPKTSFCYVGQTVPAGTRVELGLTDGTSTEASVFRAELPVSLWVAFTDGSVVPSEMRAYDDRRQLGREPIDDHWPTPRSSTCWGPIDE